MVPPAQVDLGYPDGQSPEDRKPCVTPAVDYKPSTQPPMDPKLCVQNSKDPQPGMVSAASASLNPYCESFTPGPHEVLRSLAHQLSIAKLPNPEPGVFDGNPLWYPM